MKSAWLPITIISWIWYLSTVLNESFGSTHYGSLILGCICTIICFGGKK